MSWHKYLTKRTELRGEIIFNGIKYKSLLDIMNNRTDVQSFFYEIENKFHGNPYIAWFVIPESYSLDYNNNFIQIIIGDSLEGDITLIVKQNSSDDLSYFYTDNTSNN